jgi:ribonuclease BN (tRNA processing enzyme)
MKIRVLGCHGGELPQHRTTCFLLDGKTCVDGGTITSVLGLDEILAIDDIFLTHSHFDHVKDLPLVTDLLVGRRRAPLMVHGPAETMACMAGDVFNDRLWPDFCAIPTKESPVIALQALPLRERFAHGRYTVRAYPVNHPVPSVGYVIEGPEGAVVFSGDTGPTDELWAAVNATPDLRAVFLELSFPDRMQWLADVSGHLTLRTAMGELGKLDRRGARVFLYHLKPSVSAEVKQDVAALGKDYLTVTELDDVYEL